MTILNCVILPKLLISSLHALIQTNHQFADFISEFPSIFKLSQKSLNPSITLPRLEQITRYRYPRKSFQKRLSSHRTSMPWVIFRLYLHRRRPFCQLKSRNEQAPFTASISVSRSIRSHRESLRSANFFRHKLISSAIASMITVFTSSGEDIIYCE